MRIKFLLILTMLFSFFTITATPAKAEAPIPYQPGQTFVQTSDGGYYIMNDQPTYYYNPPVYYTPYPDTYYNPPTTVYNYYQDPYDSYYQQPATTYYYYYPSIEQQPVYYPVYYYYQTPMYIEPQNYSFYDSSRNTNTYTPPQIIPPSIPSITNSSAAYSSAN